MQSVVGVFKSRSDAQSSSAKLAALGIKENRIHILTPEATPSELAAVPTMEAEQPGVVKALGAVVGGAVGFAMVEALSISGVPVLARCLPSVLLGVHCSARLPAEPLPEPSRTKCLLASRKTSYSFMRMP